MQMRPPLFSAIGKGGKFRRRPPAAAVDAAARPGALRIHKMET